MVAAEHLFDGRDEEDVHNNRTRMWEMVNLLGLPPATFLQRSPHVHRLFDTSGIDRGNRCSFSKPGKNDADEPYRRMEGRATALAQLFGEPY